MGILVNTTGTAINTNGIMPITAGIPIPMGNVATNAGKATAAIVMLFMRSLMRNPMSRRGLNLVLIMGLQVLRP